MVYTWKDALEDIGVSLNNKIAAKVHYFNTIADMKASNILRVGDMVITKGYYTTNDGGNGEYEIVNDASLVDDGGSVHDIYGGLKAKLISNEFNIKNFRIINNDITDALKCIEKIIKDSSKCKIKIPKGEFTISDEVIFSNAQGLEIVGEGFESKINIDLKSESKYAFDFRPGDFSGSALNGLTISSLYLNCISKGNIIKAGRVNDHILFDNLHISNIYNKAFHIFTKHPNTVNITQSHIEGITFRNLTLLGHERKDGEENLTDPLIVLDSNDTGGQINEVIFDDVKFQVNKDSRVESTSNSRSAIQFNGIAKGNTIRDCRFVALRDCNVIDFKKSAIGNRIYSNLFEQIVENTVDATKIISFVGIGGEINHNSVFFNRFESPINIKYYYSFNICSHNVVFEPYLSVKEVKTGTYSLYNSIFCFKNDRTSKSSSSLLANNGRGFDISNLLSIIARKDTSVNGLTVLPELQLGVIDEKGEISISAGIDISNQPDDTIDKSKLRILSNGIPCAEFLKGQIRLPNYDESTLVNAGYGNYGSMYYNTDYKLPCIKNRESTEYGAYDCLQPITQYKPSNPAPGMSFFSTILNKPLWWNGTNWIDANGTEVSITE